MLETLYKSRIITFLVVLYAKIVVRDDEKNHCHLRDHDKGATGVIVRGFLGQKRKGRDKVS